MFSLRYPTGSFTEHRLKDYWGSIVPTNPYVGLGRIDLTVKRRRCTLGRSSDVDIQFETPKISKHHCELQLEITNEGAYIVTLQDLDSTNGTFLNGVRLGRGQSVRIYDGDVFSLAERTDENFALEDDISFTFSSLSDNTEGE